MHLYRHFSKLSNGWQDYHSITMQNATLATLTKLPVGEWYGAVVEIPIRLIKPDPDNLRTEFDTEDLLDLGRNISQVGQLDAITVFPLLSDDENWTDSSIYMMASGDGEQLSWLDSQSSRPRSSPDHQNRS